mgnify:CR=1 FL=1
MLTRAVEDYLRLRRTFGFKLVDTDELLRSFVAFASLRGERSVRAQTAYDWAALGPSIQRRYRRLRTVALFVDHLRTEDINHESIPMHWFNCRAYNRYPPRIFTVDEIGRVLDRCATLWPADSTRPITYHTLFGLLFATGMRIGEALQLRLGDIDAAGLTIKETKFRKSRWLPLHTSTVAVLETYLSSRRGVSAGSDRLFLSWRRRQPLTAGQALLTFQALCADAGISGAGGRRKPRLHDLRHSFATHALRRCGAERDAVERHMLALSTYLGHVSVASTYWYLEQTPELMRDIADVCETWQHGGES